MKKTNLKRPSSSFVLVCLSYLSVSLYLFWGLRQPALDSLWELEQSLQIEGQLNQDQQQQLLAGLQTHPQLQSEWLGEAPAVWLRPVALNAQKQFSAVLLQQKPIQLELRASSAGQSIERQTQAIKQPPLFTQDRFESPMQSKQIALNQQGLQLIQLNSTTAFEAQILERSQP